MCYTLYRKFFDVYFKILRKIFQAGFVISQFIRISWFIPKSSWDKPRINKYFGKFEGCNIFFLQFFSKNLVFVEEKFLIFFYENFPWTFHEILWFLKTFYVFFFKISSFYGFEWNFMILMNYLWISMNFLTIFLRKIWTFYKFEWNSKFSWTIYNFFSWNCLTFYKNIKFWSTLLKFFDFYELFINLYQILAIFHDKFLWIWIKFHDLYELFMTFSWNFVSC